MQKTGALRVVAADQVNQWNTDTRMRTFMAASLVTIGRKRAVTVRELSATQAVLAGDDLPVAGTDVILVRRSTEAFATICWSDGGRCGVSFDERLSEKQMASQFGASETVKAAKRAQSQRPAIRKIVVSDAEMAAALAWSNVSPVERFRREVPVRY
jgi:hypothetical protein